jgi:hypothetical protein
MTLEWYQHLLSILVFASAVEWIQGVAPWQQSEQKEWKTDTLQTKA